MNRGLAILIFILVSFVSIAQETGTVRGFVYDKNTEEPVIFTNVFLQGTTIGSATDVNGYFMISKIPPGDYTLTTTFIGYDTAKVQITIKSGDILTEKLYIAESSVNLNVFDVSAEKQEAQTEVKMSMVKVTPKEIKSLPTVGGEADIAQYLQVLPGVVFTGDQGGQLYIRGGSPIQNKVLLDGMIIYNPFHSIGLFSVFDTDIMRNADIYTGGFNAQYGGRISSIMDITTRDGNRKRISGKVGASPFGAKALVEGPLVRSKELGGSSVSFIFSGKTSYLEQSSKYLYKYMDNTESTSPLFNSWEAPPTGNLPFNYTDLYGKVSVNGGNGSKLNVFGFNFRDRVNYVDVTDMNWNSYGGGSNFLIIPGTSEALVEGVFAYSKYDISIVEGADPKKSSSIGGFNGGLTFTYFKGANEIKYGIEGISFTTVYETKDAAGAIVDGEPQNTTEFGAFVKYKWNKLDADGNSKIVVEPSFRFHYYATPNVPSPEPRLGIKYNASENLRIKFAAGMYSQNLMSATSDRDVVNLFYGFYSGQENLQDSVTVGPRPWESSDKTSTRAIKHPLQKSNHFILGFEYDVSRRINVNIEGYYKMFTQLTNVNRNKIYEDNNFNAEVPDVYKKDFIVETGDAYGVDFVTKYDYKRLYVWFVYSLGRVTRFDGVQQDKDGNLANYNPVFDRRHNVNFLTTYTFGKNLDWEFNARWNLGSGFPFTPTQGFYGTYDFNTNGINSDYVSSNSDLGIYYGDLNSKRLPWYHRLDLNLKRRFEFSETTLEASIGVTNAYNRENVFYFDRVRFKRVNQLPMLPSFGINWRF